MKKNTFLFLFLCMSILFSCNSTSTPHYINIKTRSELHEWFKYSENKAKIISGHRGGMLEGYPENCIESFEKTLSFMPSFFEIDPRLTKDSVIVLMHDSTLDRTTNGKGKVSDYTFAELQKFNLVDRNGNITNFKIPTLEACIEWSQGKTILNLDIKDVPIETMSKFINSINPPNVMYTVHNAKQARTYLDSDPEAMFSLWCKTTAEADQYEAVNIPWSQCITYVGYLMKDTQTDLYDRLHKNGVMCMISVAPTHDARFSDKEKIDGYKLELKSSCDIIETDYPYLFEGLK